MTNSVVAQGWRWLAWVVGALVALQVFFVMRIALMAWWDPQSTSFQRSQAWYLWHQDYPAIHAWQQQWVDYDQIALTLKQAVLTAEDDRFTGHDGIQWEAIRKAWKRNQQAQERAEQGDSVQPISLHGGSTITQQLAKNLLLSGERSLLRKGQELLLTLMLESLLDKRRILEIYLNHAEWGQGVFGAQAAAQHYFGKNAGQLTAAQAARLAVMLPRPRYYESHPQSRYLQTRSRIIARRMAATPVP